MSLRRPSCSTRIESLSERLIKCKMPFSEKRAPSFVATDRTTSTFPRSTSTSVTSSPMDLRLEIANRCSWLLDLALATKVRASSRSDLRSTGPATSIESSKASLFVDDTGRRVVDPSQPFRELDTGRNGNIPLEQAYYLSKHP